MAIGSPASSSVVVQPRSASRRAAAAPTGPLPMTTTRRLLLRTGCWKLALDAHAAEQRIRADLERQLIRVGAVGTRFRRAAARGGQLARCDLATAEEAES